MGDDIYNGRTGIEIGDMEFCIQVSISPVNLADSTPSFHSHIAPELIVIEGGTAEIQFSTGMSISVVPGTLCYIPAGTMHCTKAAEGSPTKMGIRYAYSRNNHTPTESIRIYKIFDSVVQKITEPSIMNGSDEIEAVLSRIKKNGNDRSYLSSMVTKANYQILSVGIIRLFGIQELLHGNVIDNVEQTKLLRMNDLEGWLDFWYSHSVNETWIASSMKLSTRQINRLFHECFNMSFRDKLTEVRLSHAVDYLLGTDMNVEEIAYKVGYTTAAGFQNAFRKKYGISPGKYRRENRQKV